MRSRAAGERETPPVREKMALFGVAAANKAGGKGRGRGTAAWGGSSLLIYIGRVPPRNRNRGKENNEMTLKQGQMAPVPPSSSQFESRN